MTRPRPSDAAAGHAGAEEGLAAGSPPAARLLGRSLRAAAKAGAGAALLAGGGSLAWSWVAGPAQVFRPPDGTRWDLLLETAWSWALPTLLWVGGVVFLVRLALGILGRR